MELTPRMIKNAAEARSLAAESMVLLRNTGGALPLLGSPEEPFRLAEGQEETDGSLTLWPQRHGTDGFYLCKMRKV